MRKFGMINGYGAVKKVLSHFAGTLKNEPLAAKADPKLMAQIMDGHSCNIAPVVL